jgi:hypothetical protein
MILDRHIANRLITDFSFTKELVQLFHSKEQIEQESRAYMTSLALLHPWKNKNFVITNTVITKLDKLKIKNLDWSVFYHLEDQKKTFILPDNNALRIWIYEGYIHFLFLDMTMYDKENGNLLSVLFYIDKLKNIKCDHFEHQDVKEREEFIYKLMCFFYLTENEEILLKSGHKIGTKKSGKIINKLPFDVTIVNNNWNITSIRNEGFQVSGHFAIRWSGEGRSIPKIVFIEPFEKKGYVRKAKSTEIQST